MRRIVLGIAVAVTSLMPVMGVADDQQIADYIKSRLQAEQQQGNLRGFNVDMRVENGTVWFKGHVSNPTQEMTILKTAQQAGHLGVTQVVDDIAVRTQAAPAPVAAQQAPVQAQAAPVPAQAAPVAAPVAAQAAPVPAQAPPVPAQAVAYQQQQPVMVPDQRQPVPMVQQASPYQQVSNRAPGAPGATQGVAINGTPLPFAMAGGATGPAAMPAGYGAAAGAPSEAPNLPGYAWPGYAAHPNYAAVSYPKQHSASAWPYIGPFYPYPQVPLGWRKVSLEWDDGWWMLDFSDK